MSGKLWRHKKRGTTYEEIGRATLQHSRKEYPPLVNGRRMVIYREPAGQIWVREEDEFMDGRFEAVDPLDGLSSEDFVRKLRDEW